MPEEAEPAEQKPEGEKILSPGLRELRAAEEMLTGLMQPAMSCILLVGRFGLVWFWPMLRKVWTWLSWTLDLG